MLSKPDLVIDVIRKAAVTVNASGTPPSGHTGTFMWAQLITSNTTNSTPGGSCSTGLGLDNQFPTFTGSSFSDSPAKTLQSSSTKLTWTLGFTSYLMWRPGIANDIPIPLGSLTWSGFGDAAFNGTEWVKQSDSTTSGNAFVKSSIFPTWTNTVKNGSSPCSTQSQ
jgi:hypothetical protein